MLEQASYFLNLAASLSLHFHWLCRVCDLHLVGTFI